MGVGCYVIFCLFKAFSPMKLGIRVTSYLVTWQSHPLPGQSSSCAMYKAELEKARKEKRPIAPNLNVLPRARPFLLGSLDQIVQKFLLALQSRGGLITSVIAVSVAKTLIARNPYFMLDHIDLDSSSWVKRLFAERASKNAWKQLARSKSSMEQRKRPNFCICTRYCISGWWP